MPEGGRLQHVFPVFACYSSSLLTARLASRRISDALKYASIAQDVSILVPPVDTNGKVTPVRGKRSIDPNTFSIVCIRKIVAAPQAQIV